MNFFLSTAYQGTSDGLPYPGNFAADPNVLKTTSASFKVCRQRLIDAAQQDHPQQKSVSPQPLTARNSWRLASPSSRSCTITATSDRRSRIGT
jgi:hypothetical protein